MYGFRKFLAHEWMLNQNNTDPGKPLVWNFDGRTHRRRLQPFADKCTCLIKRPVTQFIPNDHAPYFNAQQNGGAANLRTLDLNARDVFHERARVQSNGMTHRLESS